MSRPCRCASLRRQRADAPDNPLPHVPQRLPRPAGPPARRPPPPPATWRRPSSPGRVHRRCPPHPLQRPVDHHSASAAPSGDVAATSLPQGRQGRATVAASRGVQSRRRRCPVVATERRPSRRDRGPAPEEPALPKRDGRSHVAATRPRHSSLAGRSRAPAQRRRVCVVAAMSRPCGCHVAATHRLRCLIGPGERGRVRAGPSTSPRCTVRSAPHA
jgi:hypothetical protein